MWASPKPAGAPGSLGVGVDLLLPSPQTGAQLTDRAVSLESFAHRVIPANARGALVVPKEETVDLPTAPGANPPGNKRFLLPQGTSVTVHLKQV